MSPSRRASRFIVLALAAIVGPLIGIAAAVLVSQPDPFNDFHDYWLAGQLVAAGGSPYDLPALRALAAHEAVPFLVGGGYSYPPPFAVLMIPLAGLPFATAALVFEAASLVVFGLVVAAWLERFHRSARLGRVIGVAALAGLYPPIIGSSAVGQANLLLLAPLAAGAAMLVASTPPGEPTSRGRPVIGGGFLGGGIMGSGLLGGGFIGGGLLGLVAVVKVVPAVTAVPLALGDRWRAAAGLAVGTLAPLALAGLIAPWAFPGSGALGELFAPDAFYTNSSMNGFVSRLVISSDHLSAIFPGAFDPRLPTLVLTMALAVATLVVLWRARSSFGEWRGLALGLGLSIMAATIGAPKTSFWNESFVLVAAGLLIVALAPDLSLGTFARVDRALLVAWLVGTVVQPISWITPLAAGSGMAPLATLVASASLFGLLGLWWLFVRHHDGGAVAEGRGSRPQ